MSCDSRRRKLWKSLGLDAVKMESIFRSAQQAAQGRGISPDEKVEWIDKTRRMLVLFDQRGIPRPVHSKKTDLPRRSALAGYAAVWDELSSNLPAGIGGENPKALGAKELKEALTELGQMALSRGYQVELVAVGGAAMILAYSARLSTKDVDAVILSPRETRLVREISQVIADEKGWPDDWLNDGAKGYLHGISDGPLVFSSPGIHVRIPAPAQLLAMKLSAWRDQVDIADARLLLKQIASSGDRDKTWLEIEPYLIPGSQLKAQYAFLDLWESIYGDD